MSWLTSIEPGAGWPAEATAATPAIPRLPRKRPGIQTTVYRTEPGTREFVFGQGLDAPGAAARLQDHLGYNQQLMEAIGQAGGNLQNSPQLMSLAAQNESGWKALNDQMAAEAAQSSANTQSQAQAWQESPQNFARQLLAHQVQAGTASQEAIGQAGGSVNVPVAAAESGLDKATSLGSAIERLGAQGKLPLTPGSALHQALANQYGPELAARQAGQPAHWYEHPIPWFGHGAETNVGDVLQLGIPAAIRQIAGVPSWKQQGEAQVASLLRRGGAPPTAPVAPQGQPPAFVAPRTPIGIPARAAKRPGLKPAEGTSMRPGISDRQKQRMAEIERIRRGQSG